MKYLWKLFLSLKEIFIIMMIQYVILFLCILIIGIDKSIIWGSILISLIQIIYIIHKTKVLKISINSFSYLPYLMLGIGLATVYNMIIFKLDLGFDANVDFPIILNILCSGIIGPIFEEFLFRFDLIRRLLKFNSNKLVTAIISAVIFGLFHTNIITIVYAFIVGFINSYIYIRDKNIMKPIIVHVAGNIFVNLLFEYNIWILIFGIILLIISGLIIRDND